MPDDTTDPTSYTYTHRRFRGANHDDHADLPMHRVVLSVDVGHDAPAELLDDLTARMERMGAFHVCLLDDNVLAAYLAVPPQSTQGAAELALALASEQRLIPDEVLAGLLRARVPEVAYRVQLNLALQRHGPPG